jgi:hypothetical protein
MLIEKPLVVLVLLISLHNILCVKARKISSYPDLSKTSKKFTTFTVDFRGIDIPAHTYWCLLQWYMDLTKFKESHPDASGACAYGGLQSTDTEPHGIMSFWQVEYKENNQPKTLKSTRIYPKGTEGTFDNEGVGTNFISTYIWAANVWYSILLIVGKIVQLEILLLVNGIKIYQQRNGHYMPILILD